MIEVPMTNDIRKYKPKLIGPLTLRQLICTILGLSYSVPIALSLNAGWDTKVLVLLILAAPVVACGWVNMDGLPLEVLAVRLIYFYFLAPPKRIYSFINAYRKGLPKKKKGNKNKHPVTYSNKKDFKIYT